MFGRRNRIDQDRVGQIEREKRTPRTTGNLEAVLRDFPWLWAIKNCWPNSSGGDVKVSQDMQSLKLALQQQSTNTNFTLWMFAADCWPAGIQIKKISPEAGKTWAETIMENGTDCIQIFHLAVLFPDGANVLIFRDPKKGTLNHVIEETISLMGSTARWIHDW